MGTNRTTAEFLLRVCHDLRTPLRGIRLHAELLLREQGAATPTDFAQRLGFIADGAGKIDRLVDAIARYSIALETDPDSFQSVSIGVLLRGALAKLENLLRESDSEVTYEELPRVRGNPDALIQLFEQLIRNAIDHRGDAAAARVHISAATMDEGWQFSVQDHGPGVDASELEGIFEPFERLHGSGPGLGLAICRAIVEGHGGRIWAESQLGKGCTIRFTLPSAS